MDASPPPSGARAPRRRLAGALLVGLLAVTAAAPAQGDDALRRLAERLVGTWGAPGEMRVSLHPGELPADVYVELPLPDDATLVGSLARYERDTMVSLQVVLDGAARTTATFDTLRSAFEGAGWTFIAEAGMVGFVPSAPSLFARTCAPLAEEGGRPIAFVSASPLPEGATDVRIDLTRDAWEGACTPGPEGVLDGFAPVPTLAAPAGGDVTGQLTTHDTEDAMTLAVLRGGGDVDAVIDHYGAELRSAGWTPAPGSLRHDAGVRSRWSYVDGAGIPWVGILAVEWPTRTGPIMLSFTVVAEPGP